MSVSMLLATIALYASVTAVVALTARGFNLYNLASGIWVILGGWLWYWIRSPATVPLNPYGFLIVAVIACLQIAIPWLLHRQLIHQQIAYVFATIGIAFLLDGTVPALLLNRYSAVIGLQGSVMQDVVAIAAAIVVVTICFAIMRSTPYAKATVHFRLDGQHRLLTGFIGCEICLLLFLGAVFYGAHHGLLSSSFFLTVIPVLALLVTGRVAPLAILIAGGVPGVSYLIGRIFPELAGISMPLVIVGIGCFAIVKSVISGKLRMGVMISRVLLEPQKTWGLRNRNLRGILALIAAGLILQYGFRLEAPAPANTIWTIVLAVSGIYILGFLGVFTVSIPFLGSLAAYLVIILNHSPFVLCVALILLITLWIRYILLLQAIREDYAVVADLALMLGISYFIKSSAAISGAEGVQLFPYGAKFFDMNTWLILALASGVLGMFFIYVSLVIPHLRPYVVGYMCGDSGQAHGAPVGVSRMVFILTATAIALTGTLSYYSATGSIGTGTVSLECGLAVMILASLMLRTEPAIGIIATLILFTFLPTTFLGVGTLAYAFLGAGLVFVTCLSGPLKE